MHLILALSALATAATAASASTVPPELAVIGEPSTLLNLTYSVGSTEISFKPGDFLNSTIAKDAPQPRLHDMGLSHTGPYLMLMIDPDWNKTSPPSVIVHTVVANLTTNVNSTSNANIIAKYIGPAPRSGTHNYTTFLFDQPANFSIPTRYQSFMEINDQTPLNRLNLPLESFISQTGLGTPVAANYFRVTAASNSTNNSTDNSTGTSTTSTTSTTTSTAASSTSSGAAVKMAVGQNYYVASALALVGAVIVAV